MNLMIKIFGVALIVSGSATIGWALSSHQEKRLKRLEYIKDCFELFQKELKKERRSIDAFLNEKGNFLKDDANKFLSKEQCDSIIETIEKIRVDSYEEALNRCDATLIWLTAAIDELKKVEDKNGKARPLVTGALGLLLAILLF